MQSHDETGQNLPSDQDISGRSFGSEEIELLLEVIEKGVLTSTKGSMTRALENRFRETLGCGSASVCSSGTAAIHAAVAAINPDPGEEIITTPITDMGALSPLLYQGAIPVFADVDRHTCNITAETIAPCISDRTRAIIVTHLFGNPAVMAPILDLAGRLGIPVIEDAAQAFGAQWRGRPAGTLGSIGCFSLQQGKHITSGEGGLAVSNDRELARRIFLFINKAWGYGDDSPDHYFLALNYRITELQSAVALAQLEKLDSMVERRIDAADKLTVLLKGLEGIETPVVEQGSRHSYWRYCINVDDGLIPGGATALGKKLDSCGVRSMPRYIRKPAFECEVFRDRNTFGGSHFPFTLARPEALNYSRDRYPGAWRALDTVLVLPWNEKLTDRHVQYIGETVVRSVRELIDES
jgi:dTDP-4-amino-4,6-dideoxygalactose transaminase